MINKMETKKNKKVLIALDYDPTAEKVAETGYAIAKAMGAEVILLHVVSDPLYYTLTGHVTVMGFAGEAGSGKFKSKSNDDAKNVSQHFLDSAKKHLGAEGIQTIIKEGDFAPTILKSAKELHADIIVMGSHSKKWLENIVMGSVIREVLQHTVLPVLVIPTKKQS